MHDVIHFVNPLFWGTILDEDWLFVIGYLHVFWVKIFCENHDYEWTLIVVTWTVYNLNVGECLQLTCMTCNDLKKFWMLCIYLYKLCAP